MWKVKVDDYRIHDRASCTCHMVLRVFLIAASTPWVHLLKLIFVLICYVYLWHYIVGVSMYILLVLLLWCALCSSTLVRDLECQIILRL